MVAAGGRDHAGRGDGTLQQVGERAARLERAGMLEQLQLEGEGRRGEAELGGVGAQQRGVADVRADQAFGGGDGGGGDGKVGVGVGVGHHVTGSAAAVRDCS
jgi:hypothetical protein